MTTTTIDPGRVAALDTLTIDKGAHDTWEDGHCALEVVAWLAGEHHSDSPVCVCPAIARFVRRWNDDLPDDESRERLLRPVLPRLVGTAGDAALTERRSWMAADWVVREHAPAWMDLTPALAGHADVLRALPPVADRETAWAAERAVERATDAAWEGASAAAWAAASAAAREGASEVAWEALAPTVAALQTSALDLLDRMIEAGS